MGDFISDEIESILYIAREISGMSDSIPLNRRDCTCKSIVYRIPPLKKNEGHRAQEWGDLAQPLWKGRMRIVEKSTSANLIFEDAQSGTNLCHLFVSTNQAHG